MAEENKTTAEETAEKVKETEAAESEVTEATPETQAGSEEVEEAKEKKLGEAPGEVFAAIAMAMHEMQSDVHDVEETVLTITRVKRSYSPWSSKIYTLRETPHKK